MRIMNRSLLNRALLSLSVISVIIVKTVSGTEGVQPVQSAVFSDGGGGSGDSWSDFFSLDAVDFGMPIAEASSGSSVASSDDSGDWDIGLDPDIAAAIAHASSTSPSNQISTADGGEEAGGVGVSGVATALDWDELQIPAEAVGAERTAAREFASRLFEEREEPRPEAGGEPSVRFFSSGYAGGGSPSDLESFGVPPVGAARVRRGSVASTDETGVGVAAGDFSSRSGVPTASDSDGESQIVPSIPLPFVYSGTTDDKPPLRPMLKDAALRIARPGVNTIDGLWIDFSEDGRICILRGRLQDTDLERPFADLVAESIQCKYGTKLRADHFDWVQVLVIVGMDIEGLTKSSFKKFTKLRALIVDGNAQLKTVHDDAFKPVLDQTGKRCAPELEYLRISGSPLLKNLPSFGYDRSSNNDAEDLERLRGAVGAYPKLAHLAIAKCGVTSAPVGLRFLGDTDLEVEVEANGAGQVRLIQRSGLVTLEVSGNPDLLLAPNVRELKHLRFLNVTCNGFGEPLNANNVPTFSTDGRTALLFGGNRRLHNVSDGFWTQLKAEVARNSHCIVDFTGTALGENVLRRAEFLSEENREAALIKDTGKTWQDTFDTGAAFAQRNAVDAGVAAAGVGGAAAGAKLGAFMGPLGMVVGVAIGGASGLFGGMVVADSSESVQKFDKKMQHAATVREEHVSERSKARVRAIRARRDFNPLVTRQRIDSTRPTGPTLSPRIIATTEERLQAWHQDRNKVILNYVLGNTRDVGYAPAVRELVRNQRKRMPYVTPAVVDATLLAVKNQRKIRYGINAAMLAAKCTPAGGGTYVVMELLRRVGYKRLFSNLTTAAKNATPDEIKWKVRNALTEIARGTVDGLMRHFRIPLASRAVATRFLIIARPIAQAGLERILDPESELSPDAIAVEAITSIGEAIITLTREEKIALVVLGINILTELVGPKLARWIGSLFFDNTLYYDKCDGKGSTVPGDFSFKTIGGKAIMSSSVAQFYYAAAKMYGFQFALLVTLASACVAEELAANIVNEGNGAFLHDPAVFRDFATRIKTVTEDLVVVNSCGELVQMLRGFGELSSYDLMKTVSVAEAYPDAYDEQHGDHDQPFLEARSMLRMGNEDWPMLPIMYRKLRKPLLDMTYLLSGTSDDARVFLDRLRTNGGFRMALYSIIELYSASAEAGASAGSVEAGELGFAQIINKMATHLVERL